MENSWYDIITLASPVIELDFSFKPSHFIQEANNTPKLIRSRILETKQYAQATKYYYIYIKSA